MRHTRTAVVVITLAALVPSACGGGKGSNGHSTLSALQAICQPTAQQAIARAASIASSDISGLRSKGNNGYPQCSFEARLRSGARFHALVNVDSGPQPYFVLERTAIEDSQTFTAKPLHAPAQSIARLGLEADWFPQYPYLMVTDGFRLLTITVVWPHHTQQAERALAIAISKPYLHTPHGKLAQRIAQGYPSG
jgi:hypothetical protein